jgi:hypothetical protein
MLNTDLFLQIFGGAGYLLAQILLAAAESRSNSRKLRIAGWLAYLAGMPAWIILLIGKNDWIVAGIDAGSIPSMILGIVIAWKQDAHIPKMLDVAAKHTTILMITLSLVVSIYHFHGIKTLSQALEITVAVAFLSGSYLLAKKKPEGWLLFSASCTCMVMLMAMQSKTVLLVQQGLSLIVVAAAYVKAVKRHRLKNTLANHK